MTVTIEIQGRLGNNHVYHAGRYTVGVDNPTVGVDNPIVDAENPTAAELDAYTLSCVSRYLEDLKMHGESSFESITITRHKSVNGNNHKKPPAKELPQYIIDD